MDNLTPLFSAVLPDLLAILGVVLTTLLSWAAFEVKRRFGIEVEIRKIEETDKLRDLLTQALTNGAKAAIQILPENSDTTIKAGLAVDYVQKSIPQTLVKLGKPAREVLMQRALAILFDIATAQLTRNRY